LNRERREGFEKAMKNMRKRRIGSKELSYYTLGAWWKKGLCHARRERKNEIIKYMSIEDDIGVPPVIGNSFIISLIESRIFHSNKSLINK
jgi:hypothetical protein